MPVHSLEIHFYGILKKIVDPYASMANNTVKIQDHLEDETLFELIDRLGIDHFDCGDCFINGIVSPFSTRIPKLQDTNTRVALFPLGMHLLYGGRNLKGHGYITKKVVKEIKYY
jgi:hypothetical protein